MNLEGVETQLPKYRCFKEVWALKILNVQEVPDPHDERCTTICLTFELPFTPRTVTREYMMKHDPQPGGYWVQYADGYESWSPADAFESGYVRI